MKKHLSYIFTAFSLMSVSTQAFSNDFNLPFYNAAGLGDAYAGWATAASDASTAFSNPAGLPKIQHQQLVFAPVGLLGSAQFKGSSVTPTPPIPGFIPPSSVALNGTANTRLGALFPSFYYSIPASNKLVFSIFSTVPFGLGTNYSTGSVVRYLSTRTQVVAVDYGVSGGYQLTDQVAVGLGFDATRLTLTLNNMDTSPLGFPDSNIQNHIAGWGYGWHAGILYQPWCTTRLGLSFNSMIMVHATGDSEAFTTTNEFRTKNQKAYNALPARTQLSIQHDFTPCLTGLATVFYTNWRTFKQLTLKNTMLPIGTTIVQTIPFNYHNTFDYSLGANFKATQQWLLRAGIQFMATPSNDHDRGVADPLGSGTILAIGARYTQNCCLSYDLGVAHAFFRNTRVNVTALDGSGSPITTVSGRNRTQSTVLGAQINWNIV